MTNTKLTHPPHNSNLPPTQHPSPVLRDLRRRLGTRDLTVTAYDANGQPVPRNLTVHLAAAALPGESFDQWLYNTYKRLGEVQSLALVEEVA